MIDRKIDKILIANRGEIACRVIRTCQRLGIETVAVYSDADRNSPHVYMADQAYHLGAAPAAQSYLDQEKILKAIKDSGAQAVHPGYGFLSENANFARLLEANGIILLGPSAESMELMGSKLAAKDTVKQYNIPLVPGTDQALKDIDEAVQVAKEIGFPLLIKASAGGGGKGMRIVANEAEIEEQVKLAVSEATSAFGDGSVFIEKYVEKPRHIEFQVLADLYGNTVYLFERECSIQRRHQKVVEEAPSAVLTPELRKQMGEAAVNVAKSCGYIGVGTVEFLLDAHLNFYFLEMNTRLQVEHPVTEMITGLDLVEMQIEVAKGRPLPFQQEDLAIHGHSIELRVYAEDHFNQFLPSISTLDTYQTPKMEGVRVDDGFRQGMEIPIYYDPMIAKLAVHAPTRQAAIKKMKKAIQNYHIEGIKHSLDFGTFVMDHPAFISGDFDTSFIQKYFDEAKYHELNAEKYEAAAAFVHWLGRK